MKLPWIVLPALGILVLLQPLLLLLAAHYKIMSSFQSASELASVMGAVFTAGGLIVALVSLYTLANVEKVVRDGVKGAMEDVPKQLDERIRTFLEAYTPFLKAQDLWAADRFRALPQIEESILRAESIEPTLRSLRRWSGDMYFVSARASYLRERVWDGTYGDCPAGVDRPALAMKALLRLEPEFNSGEGDRALLGIRIAEMHSLLGDSGQTVRWLKRARACGALPDLDGVNAITLAASCRSAETANHILESYGVRALDAQRIRSALHASKSPVQGFVAVIRTAVGMQNPPLNPTIVTFRTVDAWNSAFVDWNAANRPPVGTMRGGIPVFPAYDPRAGTQGNPPFHLLDPLIEEAMERFIFMVPYNFEPFLLEE